ncbi:Ubiquinone biosynthesis O-methyltransferase [Planktothrix tepida]|uniref:Methyltransferase domain-containing protein n=2 Tax=Planktothrix TaxID=54304 RepID=A0A1J1LN11_9CYAN|nr:MULTISPECIES: class I SAM-dependent methyltransferase [Planktothrix]CAD5936766.1 Ubiquinone biosynthesis O-methyltransferase [Planktothrix tepida]CAD5974787.1 Ubiquinone biosynthesis O-methyltransferase [Planktothrix pseudagardhii]CUR33378.1 conserved hypothetical protein [Planktothrix tepida PCC 9214]
MVAVNQPITVNDQNLIEKALLLKVKRLTSARGQLVLPCAPALLDEYMSQFNALLIALGQNFTPDELNGLRQLVERKLNEGYQASPHARLVFKYEPPDPTQGLTSGLKITVTTEVASLENKYQRWLTTREGPLFGSHPDAKLMAVASDLSDPARSPILDIGAGVGRNTLPLARKGHPVDAVELTPDFAQIIAKEAKENNLPIRVIQSNILNPALVLPANYYRLALIAEVISHFRNLEDVQTLLTKVCDAVVPGGLILFNTFITHDNYEPNNKVREMGQIQWSYLITRPEINLLLKSLPLELISDESVYEYERAHLPPEAWPPTNWFEHWSQGRDIIPIQNPPISLRWLLCRVKK